MPYRRLIMCTSVLALLIAGSAALAQKEPVGLGLPYKTVTNGFDQLFSSMKSEPLPDGSPRLVGRTEPPVAKFEVFGDTSAVAAAAVSVDVGPDPTEEHFQIVAGLFTRLLANMVPDLGDTNDVAKWLTLATQEVLASAQKVEKDGAPLVSGTAFFGDFSGTRVTVQLVDNIFSLRIEKQPDEAEETEKEK